MLVFHFPSFVLKIATHSKCSGFSCRTFKILSIFISAVTKPNKPKKYRHYYSKSFGFNACLFMHGIYECCSDKPQSKAKWLSLKWRKGMRGRGGERGGNNASRHKIIFKSSHMHDYKVIQQEAEHTPVQVIWKNPKSLTASLKLPLSWATITQPLHSHCLLFHGH